jgi:hypothetical protein
MFGMHERRHHIFAVKLDGTNYLTDLRVGAENNIKIDLKETKCVYEFE